MSARFPIIYVRGFAGGQGAIDAAADDPFYGLNEGWCTCGWGRTAPRGSTNTRGR